MGGMKVRILWVLSHLQEIKQEVDQREAEREHEWRSAQRLLSEVMSDRGLGDTASGYTLHFQAPEGLLQ